MEDQNRPHEDEDFVQQLRKAMAEHLHPGFLDAPFERPLTEVMPDLPERESAEQTEMAIRVSDALDFAIDDPRADLLGELFMNAEGMTFGSFVGRLAAPEFGG